MDVASLPQHIAELMINHCWRSHLISITICAGGIHEFDQIAIHPADEAEALRQGDAHAALCAPEDNGVLDEHFAELPYPGFTVTQYMFNAAEPSMLLQELVLYFVFMYAIAKNNLNLIKSIF